MSVFHRLTVPSYFGGLPAGYDYINNAIAGTPANADVQKASGPNIGTYFIAFGEDATSSDANRPNLALSTNTDYLDNQMRSDLVELIRTANTTAGAPVPTITIVGTNTIWLGSGGYVLADLFHIVDANNRDIVVSGTKVVVASISGGTIGTGFASGSVTLTLNTNIPTSTTYAVVYCQRTNLATLPIDAMTLPFVRNADSVDGSVVDFVAQVSAPGTLGSAVTALEAYSFSTPFGRLAATGIFNLDCDPTDSGAIVRQYNFRTRNNSVNRQLAVLKDDPTSSLFTGLTGIFQVDSGVGFGSTGTFFFEDTNISSMGGGMDPIWPLSSGTAGNGDLFPRLFERAITSAALGGVVAPSMLRYVNGRFCCTVGDGVTSFGDFSGVNAISVAFAYASAVGVTNLHIQVKHGSYTINAGITTTGGVVLEGVSTGQTIIQTAVPAGPTSGAFNHNGPHFTLKNLTLEYSSGQQYALIGAAGSALFMDNVVVNDLGIQMVNSATYNNIAAVYCRQCRFAPATVGVIAVDLQFTTNANVHDGYYFENCAWFCADETQTVRILGASTSTQTVKRVRFQACNYTLGGTATTSSHLTHNTGVLEINPNGGNSLLTVVDVEWVDCFPFSTTTVANAPLARIYSVALGDNSAAHLANIGRLTIRGGRWTCNASGSDTAISPVLLAAQEVVIDDVIFVGCAGASGGPSSEDQYIVDGTTYSPAAWAQFIFAPGAQTVSTSTADTRLSMSRVAFHGFNQLSNSGDIWFVLGGITDVHGITLCDYASGGTGVVPNSRLRVSPNQTAGAMRDVRLIGATSSSSAWTTTAFAAGLAAIVVLLPTKYTIRAQTFTIEGLNVDKFVAGSGTPDDGILLRNLTALDTSGGWQYTLINCVVRAFKRGLVMYGAGDPAAGAASGGNGLALDSFSVVRGDFSQNTQEGVHMWPDMFGFALFDGVRIANNGSSGMLIFPQAWPAGTCSVTVVNGHFLNNTTYEFDQRSSSADSPTIIFRGNTCLNGGGAGKARFQQGVSGSALPTSVPIAWQGMQTGIDSLGSGGQVNFGSGDFMMENVGRLATPA